MTAVMAPPLETFYQSPVARSGDSTIRLGSPETFDIRTTTDAELRRMRSGLNLELLDAAVDHGRAETRLADLQAEQDTRREEQLSAEDYIARLERISTESAISQFTGTYSDRQGFPSTAPTDGLVRDAFSTYATDHLTGEQERAALQLERAELSAQKAERAVRQARTKRLHTERTLDSTRLRIAAFELRAREHQRVAVEADRRAAARSDQVGLRSVAGKLTVNVSIEADIDRLIADARLDGHDLGGGGFRTSEEQIRLRLAHCDQGHESEEGHDPTDASHIEYVVHLAPSSTCSPPTAPPGESEHQSGLALDLTESGQLLTRGSPAYQWLVENAHAYGLVNLPSEPWHWSTTGH